MVMEHTAILGPSYLLQLIVELWSKHVKATTLILPLYEMAKPKSGSEDNTNGSWCLLKSQGKSKLESKSNLVLASCQHWEFRGQGELGVRRTSDCHGRKLAECLGDHQWHSKNSSNLSCPPWPKYVFILNAGRKLTMISKRVLKDREERLNKRKWPT